MIDEKKRGWKGLSFRRRGWFGLVVVVFLGTILIPRQSVASYYEEGCTGEDAIWLIESSPDDSPELLLETIANCRAMPRDLALRLESYVAELLMPYNYTRVDAELCLVILELHQVAGLESVAPFQFELFSNLWGIIDRSTYNHQNTLSEGQLVLLRTAVRLFLAVPFESDDPLSIRLTRLREMVYIADLRAEELGASDLRESFQEYAEELDTFHTLVGAAAFYRAGFALQEYARTPDQGVRNLIATGERLIQLSSMESPRARLRMIRGAGTTFAIAASQNSPLALEQVFVTIENLGDDERVVFNPFGRAILDQAVSDILEHNVNSTNLLLCSNILLQARVLGLEYGTPPEPPWEIAEGVIPDVRMIEVATRLPFAAENELTRAERTHTLLLILARTMTTFAVLDGTASTDPAVTGYLAEVLEHAGYRSFADWVRTGALRSGNVPDPIPESLAHLTGTYGLWRSLNPEDGDAVGLVGDMTNVSDELLVEIWFAEAFADVSDLQNQVIAIRQDIGLEADTAGEPLQPGDSPLDHFFIDPEERIYSINLEEAGDRILVPVI